MRTPARREYILHTLFTLGVWIKAVDGVLEIAGGLLVSFVSAAALNRFVVALTQHELVEDPHDLIANFARQATAQLSANTQLFASLYLIAHGIVKIGLVAGK
jgi:uncharacterized membrane protein